MVAASPSQSVSRYQLALPNLSALRPAINIDADSDHSEKFTFLYLTAESILAASRNYADLQIDLVTVVATFKDRLKEIGLCHSNRNVNVRLASSAYQAFVRPILDVSEFQPILGQRASMIEELMRFFRGRPRRTHPVRIILIAQWLFGTLDAFIDCINMQYDKSEKGI